MNNKEIWKDIPNYEGYYQVSNLGRVKSLSREVRNDKGVYVIKDRIKKPYLDTNGYYVTTLRLNNKSKKHYYHRLISVCFIDNPKNKPCVNHISGIKTDNSLNNLEWCTYSENMKHAYDNKLNIPPHERRLL